MVAQKRRKKPVKKAHVEPVEHLALPIKHWSHSSLMAFLRNPLAWYKRYVEKIYDNPANPSSVIGRSGHVALQHYYGGVPKDGAIALGLEYLRAVPDFEINMDKARSRRAKKKMRQDMEEKYLRAIGFYLERPPKHDVVGVEVVASAEVDGLALPIKAISDLVVKSRGNPGCLDIVDHKFVAAFSKEKGAKTLFVMQAIFNYYTISKLYGKPIRRFIVVECKTSKNKDGAAQMRKYVIDFAKQEETFRVFHRLINDATAEIASRRRYLPNPSDMFEGENSFDIYRMELMEE